MPTSINPSKREQILEGARTCFFAHGYQGASMNDIALAAGVSKGTLYAYYADKQALFAAVIAFECSDIAERNFVFDPDATLADSLRNLGRGLLSAILTPNAMGVFRTVVSEAHRDPSLGAVFWDSGPRSGARSLAALLAHAHARGEVETPDTTLAAFQFIFLCDAGLSQRAHMGTTQPTAAEINFYVDSAVTLFLRGYAPR
jgi:TetR/AcrR family transcriptional regulator, mexJK operon transcriptional repressor